MTHLKQLSRTTQIFIGLLIFYALLSFILPASTMGKSMYHLSTSQYHDLLFTVRIPIMATWCVVFYSFRRLAVYAQQIHTTPEGKDFSAIARGMSWIAWGFPVPAIIIALVSALANSHPIFSTVSVLLTSYLYVVVSLVAFISINDGTHSLAHRSHVYLSNKHIRLVVAGLVVVGVVFCTLIAAKLHSANLNDAYNSFYVPNWMVWTTVVMPYLFAWALGLYAAFELGLIARRTSGVIYRHALQLLAVGLMIIIVSMCALQSFRAILPRKGPLTLSSTLITAYAIYGATAIGCVLLANGVKQLKRIEDI